MQLKSTCVTRFKHINNGKHVIAVLIPGWATDWQIFDKLDINCDLIVPEDVDAGDFSEALFEELKGQTVVLFGWSLGALLAAHFMAKYPDSVKRAYLFGIKEKYAQDEIDKMKEYLLRDKRGYLELFYRKCFHGHDEPIKKWFNESLKNRYLEEMSANDLVNKLNYMRDNPFPVKELQEHSEKIHFYYAQKDAIIPPSAAGRLMAEFERSHFEFMENAGHLSFYDAKLDGEL